jgi:acetyltransferase-like isoleucine patch superfamily enzyme
MPEIKISDGAIIGANSVVTKNVDPYTIVAGNPAKVIIKNFESTI